MRRRPGIGGLQTAADATDQYRLLGENVAKLKTDLMKEQLTTFRSQLEEFARKHKNDIRKNPTFRAQFHKICAKVGVDPVASNKGFWAELLQIGDFYYELARSANCRDMLRNKTSQWRFDQSARTLHSASSETKSDREAVSEDDCLRAISKLKILGSGFEVISVGKRKLVRSVPTELNKDHNEILELAQLKDLTVDKVERRLSWTSGRATDALDTLLDEELAMIDDGHRDGKRRYWFPCVSSVSSSMGSDI